MLCRNIHEREPGMRQSHPPLTPDQRNAFVAALLGWTMDAFDYFIVVLVYADIAKSFHVSLTKMAFLTTATLIMRPVGAFVFGLWADHVGRRLPLLVDVTCYSLIGFACAFAPNYTVLLVLRLLYGVGMGGEWGLGAALAMEKVPVERRGFFSGVLQQGYALGYLLAAVAYLVVSNFTSWGWRGLFAFSLLPALLSLYVRSRVGESEAWERSRERAALTSTSFSDVLFRPAVLRRLVYLVLLMTAFNWMSHGTQDIYPTFLKDGLHFSSNTALYVAIIYNIGAIIGGTVLGTLSERIGRRRTVMLAATLGLPLIPHEIRGFYPGVTYQLGNCVAAFNLPIQHYLARTHGYGFTLTVTLLPVLLAVIGLTAIGTEAKGAVFAETPPAPQDATRVS
jgi:SHS family lactate transporter-like MFS transporter